MRHHLTLFFLLSALIFVSFCISVSCHCLLLLGTERAGRGEKAHMEEGEWRCDFWGKFFLAMGQIIQVVHAVERAGTQVIYQACPFSAPFDIWSYWQSYQSIPAMNIVIVHRLNKQHMSCTCVTTFQIKQSIYLFLNANNFTWTIPFLFYLFSSIP